jgi:hypothetical protein
MLALISNSKAFLLYEPGIAGMDYVYFTLSLAH